MEIDLEHVESNGQDEMICTTRNGKLGSRLPAALKNNVSKTPGVCHDHGIRTSPLFMETPKRFHQPQPRRQPRAATSCAMH